ncbi:hypothetical protein [Brevibacillus invocatus]|uniref:hypothetical protein n=1 Tax=Brevibacillus invocatus TaxID=173959 RepID=UPI0026A59F6F
MPPDIDITVLRNPCISNFTGVDPFFVEPDCRLCFVTRLEELGEPIFPAVDVLAIVQGYKDLAGVFVATTSL